MKRLRDLAVSALVMLVARRRRAPDERARRIVPEGSPSPRAEAAALLLLGLASALAVAFVVVYALDRLPRQTQLLGAALGLSFLCFGAAMIVTAKKLVETEEIAEPYPPPGGEPHEQELVAQVVEESGSRFTRRRLFTLGIAGATGTLGIAALTPALSFGPLLQNGYFFDTPWGPGRRLVDESERPYLASEIEEDALYTAFPEGTADRDQLPASVVLVRLRPEALRLPETLQGFAADGGVVAYSKICTHAGCAISMYRTPLFPPAAPAPALVCPCHYSTFDPADGGSVTFGPAGRKLPMLPLVVDGDGFLRAGGSFDEAVGPSWWGVRRRRPT